ncbi:MAG TPA: DNA polymerase domain-containing protein [Nitrososphaera sp.]|nr:DNA polymerase domain-containing protein [Nitrososphaera sp.]
MLRRRNDKGTGIETRRHDTPPLFSRFQGEILDIIVEGNSIIEVKTFMPRVNDTFQRYKQILKEGRVPLADLIFTKMLSKDSDAYTLNTVETSALYQLHDEGRKLRA